MTDPVCDTNHKSPRIEKLLNSHSLEFRRWSIAQRSALGKKLRDRCKRSAQAIWKPATSRRNPVDLLLHYDSTRVSALLPIKYQRMSVSPFAFFRGSAPVMAEDFGALPHSGVMTQICGDAHVRNLGAYASQEGHLVFDINDFDESLVGPWEWDLKRLAVSFVLAGRECGAADHHCSTAVRTLVQAYREGIGRFSTMPFLELVRHRVTRALRTGTIRSILSHAERATPGHNLQKLALTDAKGKFRFRSEPPLLRRLKRKEANPVLASLDAYVETLSADRRLILSAYHPVDVAMKVVGTGSVGTKDYVVLLFGIDENDPLFLQIKQEPPSCWSRYGTSTFAHQGERVAVGQRRMQTISDPLLGWTSIGDEHYLVRQLSDHKSSIDMENLDHASLTEYAAVCGAVFARAHARTGDAVALDAYFGKSAVLDDAIEEFARTYAETVNADYELFRNAIADGRIQIAATEG